MRRLVAAAVVVVVTVGLAMIALYLWPDSTTDAGIVATSIDDVQAAEVTYVADERLFLVATPDGFIALWDDARHLGNRVLYCDRDGTFLGGYGERFDHLGRYLAGPATGDMGRYPIEITADVVIVDVSDDPQLAGRTDTDASTNGPSPCSGAEEDPPGFFKQ
jgi:hypothetical protein